VVDSPGQSKKLFLEQVAFNLRTMFQGNKDRSLLISDSLVQDNRLKLIEMVHTIIFNTVMVHMELSKTQPVQQIM
jgi:hypothetical protein